MTKKIELNRRDFLLSSAVMAGAVGTGGFALGAKLKGPEEANGPVDLNAPANPRGKFAGKVVLVTGGTAGIGKRTAWRFAQKGAFVFICGRRTQVGEEAQKEMRDKGGKVTYFQADVVLDADLKNLTDACVKAHGRLDIAVNCAATGAAQDQSLETLTGDVAQMILRTNLTGTLMAMHFQIEQMLKNTEGGSIVNISTASSILPFLPYSGGIMYSSSKSAVNAITRTIAHAYADKNIRANVILPGAVENYVDPQDPGSAERAKKIEENLPIHRLAKIEEVANVILWLSSSEASYVSGALLPITGGA